MKYFESKAIIKAFVEVGFIGSFPYAQGTICSFIAALLGCYINFKLGSEVTFSLAIISGVIGLIASKMYIKDKVNKDPSNIVIDELSGQLIVTSIAGTSVIFNIIAFLLFRFFDILKPGIIEKADNLNGALGIMIDDWLAAIFASIIIILLSQFFSINYNWFWL